jgi:hypothetical protein
MTSNNYTCKREQKNSEKKRKTEVVCGHDDQVGYIDKFIQ